MLATLLLHGKVTLTKHHIFSYGQFIKLYQISKFGQLVYRFCAYSASTSQQIQNVFLSNNKVTALVKKLADKNILWQKLSSLCNNLWIKLLSENIGRYNFRPQQKSRHFLLIKF